MKITRRRCGWARTDLLIEYHDREWGAPLHDDGALFEFLVLEGAQAGLSWETILRKRPNYRVAFDCFDPRCVQSYDSQKISELLSNPGIVRNPRKIDAAVCNAKAFIAVQNEFGTFDAYVWRFVGGRPIKNTRRTLEEIPSQTSESRALSKDLTERGFRFVGPVICYAFMQAVGMVNDHVIDCFRYEQVG